MCDCYDYWGDEDDDEDYEPATTEEVREWSRKLWKSINATWRFDIKPKP